MVNLKNIKSLINSVQKNVISQVKIKNNHTEILISKARKKDNDYVISTNTYNDILNNIDYTNSKQYSANNEYISEKASTITKSEEDNTELLTQYSTLISPMVGTFYRSPAPNESPFVEVNDKVKLKQTVCIIEAMKLMNEIEAETEGEVVEILVKDGDIVDCGQALMKIKMI
uniref:Biotin carboxyl carrier protein of acetyl-CoA carboxylase n=1 Tax=Alsidium seaforthii TaxID=2007182 RepID=A0A1Z1MDM9_9FLOR|nr:acetyl-CoA carboxylase biotin carboxyl carrier protein [Bryothamnion seaforthii]ARW63972.1 acetyl-CoA carboxylase biotin carboxyl carrier protein [Bryothamnion seaforthii]